MSPGSLAVHCWSRDAESALEFRHRLIRFVTTLCVKMFEVQKPPGDWRTPGAPAAELGRLSRHATLGFVGVGSRRVA